MKNKFFTVFTLLLCGMLVACGQQDSGTFQEGEGVITELNMANEAPDWNALTQTGSLSLTYAKQFSVDYYGENYKLIHIDEVGNFLLMEENAKIPKNLPAELTVLQKPLDRTYLVSTSACDLIRQVGGLDQIKFSGTKQTDWALTEMAEAMDEGRVSYAGKYNAPDYEMLLSGGCNLAIENTMIYHDPQTLEQLQNFGIPVIVERSSYETHPLGRMEWLKLYGQLFSCEEAAEDFWNQQMTALEPILSKKQNGQKIAFFSITSNGMINVRKTNDYIANLIRLAGGEYAIDSLEGEDENALGTMKMQLEEFYATCKNADIIIYNSTIEGEIENLPQLLQKNGMLEDFKAVKEGRVYCVKEDLFQKTTELGRFLEDLNTIMTKDAEEDLKYLYRLQ